MRQTSKWSPVEVRKTISLISGVLLFFVGTYLFINQTKAEGLLEVNIGVLSGNIKSGSAGLFSCFFGLILISFSIFNLNLKERSRTNSGSGVILTNKFSHLILPFLLIIFAMTMFAIFQNPMLLALAFIFAIPFLKISEIK